MTSTDSQAASLSECPECEGTGRVRGPGDELYERRTGWEHARSYKCSACDGTGRLP